MIIYTESHTDPKMRARLDEAGEGPWTYEKDLYVGHFWDPDTEVEMPVVTLRNSLNGVMETLIFVEKGHPLFRVMGWADHPLMRGSKCIYGDYIIREDPSTIRAANFPNEDYLGMWSLGLSGQQRGDLRPLTPDYPDSGPTYRNIGFMTEQIDRLAQRVVDLTTPGVPDWMAVT